MGVFVQCFTLSSRNLVLSPSVYFFSQSENVKLLNREIIFEVFQPVRKRYLNVTDRQTDGRKTYCGITALCVYIASRGKKSNEDGQRDD